MKNKIYNNLTIENLINTDWFNQFNEYQQECLKEGLEQQLDVSIYAKPHISYSKMTAIKYILQEGVEEIKKYVNMKYDGYQLHIIADDLKANKDVSLYAKPEYNWEQCEIIRKGLYSNNNIDISLYANPKFSSVQMEQIRLGLEEDLDISKYANPKTDYVEMKKIRLKLLEEKRNEKQNT